MLGGWVYDRFPQAYPGEQALFIAFGMHRLGVTTGEVPKGPERPAPDRVDWENDPLIRIVKDDNGDSALR